MNGRTRKADTQTLAQSLGSPEKDALLAHVGDLTKPADFMDIMSARASSECANDQSYAAKTRIMIYFGNKATSIKRIWLSSLASEQVDAEVRRARCARGPHARASQDKLDRWQKSLKK